jgi:hypothetical protein
MYRVSKPYRNKQKSIYSKRHRRRSGPLLAAVMLAAAVILLFIGWSIEPMVQDLITGKYRVPTGGSSKSSSRPSSSSKPASSSSNTSKPAQISLKGLYLSQSSLSDLQGLDKAAAAAKQAGLNLAVVELKGEDGLLHYASKISEAQSGGMIAPNAPDAAAAAQELIKNSLTPAAEISCFKDPIAPYSIPNSYVLYSGDHAQGWLDNPAPSGHRWLNPYSTAAQQYIIDLAVEAVGLGYKQIYLNNVEFPINDSKAWYGDGLPSKEDALKSFVADATKKIEAAGGTVSVIMPGGASVGQGDPQTGQDQSIYGFAADYLSPNLCPSLMGSGITIGGASIPKPDLTPGDTVTAAAVYLKSQAGAKLSVTVPFIQAFTNTGLGNGNYKQYTSADINAEIAALKNAGITNFVLYAPDGSYDLSGISAK